MLTPACYYSLRSQQLGQNAFQITFGDGILPCMSRDFAIIHGKTPRGILPVNSYACLLWRLYQKTRLYLSILISAFPSAAKVI